MTDALLFCSNLQVSLCDKKGTMHKLDASKIVILEKKKVILFKEFWQALARIK
jgi:hypothetical protein